MLEAMKIGKSVACKAKDDSWVSVGVSATQFTCEFLHIHAELCSWI